MKNRSSLTELLVKWFLVHFLTVDDNRPLFPPLRLAPCLRLRHEVWGGPCSSRSLVCTPAPGSWTGAGRGPHMTETGNPSARQPPAQISSVLSEGPAEPQRSPESLATRTRAWRLGLRPKPRGFPSRAAGLTPLGPLLEVPDEAMQGRTSVSAPECDRDSSSHRHQMLPRPLREEQGALQKQQPPAPPG